MMTSFGWLALNANIDHETKMNRHHTDASTGFQFSWLAALTCRDLQRIRSGITLTLYTFSLYFFI